jgi:GNAT superfamily N-acetyltransferase
METSSNEYPRSIRNSPQANKMTLLYLLFSCLFLVKVCDAFVPPSEIRQIRRSTHLYIIESEVMNFPTTTDVPESSVKSRNSEEDAEAGSDQETDARSQLLQDSSYLDDMDEAFAERLARTQKADDLLERRTTRNVQSRSSTPNNASLGARRVGSEPRRCDQSTDKLLDAVRKATSANTADPDSKTETDKPSSDANVAHADLSASARATTSAIHAAVAEMLDHAYRNVNSLGLFSDPVFGNVESVQQQPAPGTVLAHSSQQQSRESYKISSHKPSDRLTVRVATTYDDYDIASLRLSVFSECTPEMRRNFCSRSCQVLASRRSRGATCIVTTVPRHGSVLLSPRPDIILGTAEVSTHEFLGTTLGQIRLQDSTMYITEVAVSPSARRKGVGSKMIKVSEAIKKWLRTILPLPLIIALV